VAAKQKLNYDPNQNFITPTQLQTIFTFQSTIVAKQYCNSFEVQKFG
jgi:hypothetical protein